jgi:hypothetical protein
MIYRCTQPQTVYVEALGRDVPMDPAQPFDDDIPEQALIVAEWGPKGRGLLFADNVEAATAAPGEKRTTRRSKPKAEPEE